LTLAALSVTLVWGATLVWSVLLRTALRETVSIIQVSPKPRRRRKADRTDKDIRFMGRDIRTGSVVTESDLLGAPSTIVLLSPKNVLGQIQGHWLRLVELAWRRSYGRLWVLCQGSRESCSHIAAQINASPGLSPVVVAEPTENIGSVCPVALEVCTIILVDKEGRLMSYGFDGTNRTKDSTKETKHVGRE
jgi:hypothetical protein